MEMYTEHVPINFIKTVKELSAELLWDSKKWRVAHRTMTLLKEHGDIQLPDFECKTKQLMWILKITHKTYSIYGIIIFFV